jgi:hypothetical protein
VGRVETPIVIVLVGLVAMGVVVMAMGHRQVVHTTPLIQAVPSYAADASRITNLINTTNAIAAHQQMSHTLTPST